MPDQQKTLDSLDRAIGAMEALKADASIECANEMPRGDSRPGIRYIQLWGRCEAIVAVLVQLEAIRDADLSRLARWRAKADVYLAEVAQENRDCADQSEGHDDLAGEVQP
jgi:hypothetical protein